VSLWELVSPDSEMARNDEVKDIILKPDSSNWLEWCEDTQKAAEAQCVVSYTH
jgi:hypothetical protein